MLRKVRFEFKTKSLLLFYIPVSFRKVADFHFLTSHFYLSTHRNLFMTFTKRPITGKILEQTVLCKGLEQGFVH